jgi:hypothetical protein
MNIIQELLVELEKGVQLCNHLKRDCRPCNSVMKKLSVELKMILKAYDISFESFVNTHLHLLEYDEQAIVLIGWWVAQHTNLPASMEDLDERKDTMNNEDYLNQCNYLKILHRLNECDSWQYKDIKLVMFKSKE